MKKNIETILSLSPIIPVIVINESSQAVPLATALFKGGLKVLEITLRTSYALEAITAIKKALPDAIIGAGTILSAEDLAAAKNAGAEFIVCPGATEALVDAALLHDVPLLPGIATPSEAMKLMEAGFTHMKFFPAEAAGGISMIKAVYGPFPQLKFCPTGGITAGLANEYLTQPNVLCVGGSWMIPQNLINKEDWKEIEILARETVAAISQL